MIAVNTDSHSTGELPLIRRGIDRARRVGLEKTTILNCLPWEKLQRLLRRQKIVERYGGQIWVDSMLGRGAEFLFKMPLHPPGR